MPRLEFARRSLLAFWASEDFSSHICKNGISHANQPLDNHRYQRRVLTIPPSSPTKNATGTPVPPMKSGLLTFKVLGLIGPWPCLLPISTSVEFNFPLDCRKFKNVPRRASASCRALARLLFGLSPAASKYPAFC